MDERKSRTSACSAPPSPQTGKCIDFAKVQMTSPSGPATVSTLLEAEYFFNLGVIDLIYAVGISPGKFERAVNLREAGCDLKVILDNKETAEQFSGYCEERKIPCPVFYTWQGTIFLSRFHPACCCSAIRVQQPPHSDDNGITVSG